MQFYLNSFKHSRQCTFQRNFDWRWRWILSVFYATIVVKRLYRFLHKKKGVSAFEGRFSKKLNKPLPTFYLIGEISKLGPNKRYIDLWFSHTKSFQSRIIHHSINSHFPFPHKSDQTKHWFMNVGRYHIFDDFLFWRFTTSISKSYYVHRRLGKL